MNISRGLTRTVVCIGPFAIKFPRMGAQYRFKDGLHANWSEFWFYATTRNPFVWPTWFSFFGIFNIQKRGFIFLPEEHGPYIMEVIAMKNKGDIGSHHSVAYASNFVLTTGGQLYICDYASKELQKMLRKHGEKLAEHFVCYQAIIRAQIALQKCKPFY